MKYTSTVNLSPVIEFLKKAKATSIENAVIINSKQWYEFGFSLGHPIGGLFFSPIKKTSGGKYWYDESSSDYYIKLNRIFLVIILIVIAIISFIIVYAITTQKNSIEIDNINRQFQYENINDDVFKPF